MLKENQISSKGRGLTKLVIVALIFSLVSGCASIWGYNVKQGKNTKRAIVVWKKDPNEKKGFVTCVEFVTPAEKLHDLNIKLTGEAKFTKGSPKIVVNYKDTQSLAQIYTVSDIMQFGHMALYRLCEARANGFIPLEDEYVNLFKKTLENVTALMHTQITLPAAIAEINREVAELELKLQGKLKLQEKEGQKIFDGEPSATLDAEIKQLETKINKNKALFKLLMNNYQESLIE